MVRDICEGLAVGPEFIAQRLEWGSEAKMTSPADHAATFVAGLLGAVFTTSLCHGLIYEFLRNLK